MITKNLYKKLIYIVIENKLNIFKQIDITIILNKITIYLFFTYLKL